MRLSRLNAYRSQSQVESFLELDSGFRQIRRYRETSAEFYPSTIHNLNSGASSLDEGSPGLFSPDSSAEPRSLRARIVARKYRFARKVFREGRRTKDARDPNDISSSVFRPRDGRNRAADGICENDSCTAVGDNDVCSSGKITLDIRYRVSLFDVAIGLQAF